HPSLGLFSDFKMAKLSGYQGWMASKVTKAAKKGKRAKGMNLLFRTLRLVAALPEKALLLSDGSVPARRRNSQVSLFEGESQGANLVTVALFPF
ncbi:hypothetical protein, partial [Pontibacter beigongshangensis]|uniref:hypothetical protein n=1 Tax=Pontibacter beigongshangensis TaxID=2574733 RepID=UPI0016505B81